MTKFNLPQTSFRKFGKMSATITIATAAVIFLTMAFSPEKKHTDVYNLDSKQSKMEWTGEKIGGKHSGTIMLTAGTISNTHGKLAAEFEADMTSITCTDLEGEYKGKLEGHLKSDDFFGVAKFPKARIVSTSIVPVKDAEGRFTHHVVANLTIKDKTNEISFDANIREEAGRMVCTGTVKVDRSKYDIRYGSKTFFENIGDKMIYDEFTLTFNVVALK